MDDKRIMVVMNDETSADLATMRFVVTTLKEYDYLVFATSSGFTAMQEMRESYPIVLAEINTIGIGAFELLQTAKMFDPDSQIIIIATENYLKDAVEILRLGAFDYMLKPITDPMEIMNKVNNALATRELISTNKQLMKDLQRANYELLNTNSKLESANSEIEKWNRELEARVRQRTQQLEQLLTSTVKTMMNAVEEKDPYTRGHSMRVTAYSVLIAREMNLPEDEINTLRLSAELHDIGKIGIKDKILLFAGKLSDEDLAVMRTHPERGAKILEPIEMLHPVIPGVRWHHEWWDGAGYPDGLKGEEIPLMARIMGIADTFDAMTSTRSYQKRMDPNWVVDKIRGWAGSRYDPQIVAAFLRGWESGRIRVIESDDSLVETYEDKEIPVVGPPPRDEAQQAMAA